MVKKKRTYFHQQLIKREVKYRVVELFVIALTIVYYIVQKYTQTYNASLTTGILTLTFLTIFLFCLFTQVLIQLFSKFILKQSQHLYETDGFELSSLRPSKPLEETVENFQTTDQGIMDMVLFGRNREVGEGDNRKMKSKRQERKGNIHLMLNQSVENNQQQLEEKIQGFTPSVSPNHRQLEKMLKLKTSRTSKNGRTNRFKLHKAFETQMPEQNAIQENAQPTKISPKEEQNFNEQEQLPKKHQQPHEQKKHLAKKSPTKAHILNIFNSEQEQDDIQDQPYELQLNQPHQQQSSQQQQSTK